MYFLFSSVQVGSMTSSLNLDFGSPLLTSLILFILKVYSIPSSPIQEDPTVDSDTVVLKPLAPIPRHNTVSDPTMLCGGPFCWVGNSWVPQSHLS